MHRKCVWLFEDAGRMEMIRFTVSSRMVSSCPANESIVSFIFLFFIEFCDSNMKSGWSSVMLANVWRRVALRQSLSFWNGPDVTSSVIGSELTFLLLSCDARDPWGMKRMRIRERRGSRGPPSGVKYSMVESCSCFMFSFSLSQTLNIKESPKSTFHYKRHCDLLTRGDRSIGVVRRIVLLK